MHAQIKKAAAFLLAILAIGLSGKAQTDSCSCSANLRFLEQKTETDYIAYLQKIKEKPGEHAYAEFKAVLGAKAARTAIAGCIGLLKEYCAYFTDGHLFVFESPSYSPDELAAFRKGLRKIALDEKAAKEYLDKNSASLDPIEGIWYAPNGSYRLAVIRDRSMPSDYTAIVLSSSNPAWGPGLVKAVFKKEKKGYSAIYHSGDFAKADYEATATSGAVLHIGALVTWGRSYPTASREQGYIDPNDASLPTVTRLGDSDVLVTVPSFLIEYAYMDSLVKAHRGEISSAAHLIIDIRGNGGGNAIYFPLINLYYTRPHKDSRGLALSSPDNIRYFERMASYETKRPGDTALGIYSRVVADMKKSPGQIVKGPDYPMDSNDSIFPLPRKVCIITDRACASAAESFILHSKGFSDRVTTFGSNTHGMIDYVSTNGLSLLCARQGYYFGYPTSTLNEQIPLGGFNEKGIPPDVRIADGVKDKIQFVLDWLKGK